MADPLPYRIFLASPGDLEDERSAVRACVEEHRARRERHTTVAYEIVDWAQVRGTAQRAQAAINELIAESHFMIVLFKKSWGSEPGSPWGYTSGTEEELFTGLLELGRAEQPMRDIWVGFVETAAPDDRIVNLRRQIKDQHSLMFESINGLRELKESLEGRLESWESLTGAKIPRHIDLLPSSGKDVLKAANLRIKGEKLIELGQAAAGRTSLQEAAVLGGPTEQLAYGRMLRRDGDLEGAYAATQKAIDHYVANDVLYSAMAADAFAAQARVLRAQGQHHEAVGRLEHALTLLIEPDDEDARGVRCRILDDLGLARQKVGDLPGARRDFELSLQIRQAAGKELDECQSLVNLARVEVGDNGTGAGVAIASGYVDRVLSILEDSPPLPLHANAHVLAAQIRLRQGEAAGGVPHAERAVAINRQLANRQGEAIALLVLAQCCRESGHRPEAESHAKESLALNEAMGNDVGAGKARWLLQNLDG